MSERREDLIERALEYFLAHGLAGLSLRPLAKKIGTSARLLVYHFGSKDGLVAAVMDEVRARVQKSFVRFMNVPNKKRPSQIMPAFWAWVIHPSNVRYMRLLFEVQILAIQNPKDYAHYLEGTSSSWLDLIESSLPPSGDRRTIATLCTAVIDGLLIEYLSTRDQRRTTAALAHFNQLLVGKRRVEK